MTAAHETTLARGTSSGLDADYSGCASAAECSEQVSTRVFSNRSGIPRSYGAGDISEILQHVRGFKERD